MSPFSSTWTRMTSPHLPPFIVFGRLGQPSTRRYGFGSSVGLGYGVCCARAASPNTNIDTSAVTIESFVCCRFMSQAFYPYKKAQENTKMAVKFGLARQRKETEMNQRISKWMLRISMMAVVTFVTQPLQAELVEKAKKVGGTTVHYKVVLPNGYDPAKAYPAILAFG